MLNKHFSKSSKKKEEEKRQENNRNSDKNRIVHESPFLLLLWLKIRNKRNLLKSAITNEYELSAKHGLLNEKYYGNRVGLVLDAWTVNGSWRRHFVDSVSMWWRSTTNRFFLFRETSFVAAARFTSLNPFFVRDQRFRLKTHILAR